jgi:hypothetical protein
MTDPESTRVEWPHPGTAGIGRGNYAIRLLAGLVIAVILYGLVAIALMSNVTASSTTLFVPLMLATFVINIIGTPYGLGKYVFIPRLTNAGFAGPVMWLMVVLCFFPPTAFLVWIALLFVPTRFVR